MIDDIRWVVCSEGARILINGQEAGVAVGMEGADDHFAMMAEGAICWTRTAALPADEMEMTFLAAYKSTYTMAPAVQYDGNKIKLQDYFDVRNSKNTDSNKNRKSPFLSYFLGDREPESGLPWRFVWHRISIPGATYSEGPAVSIGMYLPPDQMDAACSLYEEGGKTVHSLIWPEQEGPHKVHIGNEQRVNYRVPIKPRREFKAILVVHQVEEPRMAWHFLLDTAWKQYYQLKPPTRNNRELWELGVAYAKLLYTEEEDGFKGFSIGFTWKDKWVKREIQKYEIGWCGQNASLANSLLVHALMYGDEEAKSMGINVLDAWIAAVRPNGLIPTHYDDNIYTNGFEKTVDACNLGTAALQFFEAADRAAALGVERPAYTEMAETICNFALKVMNESGRIGKSWLEKDLSPAVTDGSTGAFLSMALCEAARRTGNERYLEGAIRSSRYYIEELSAKGYTTAGALDIFTIDKESCIPLLKGNLMLYEFTKQREFLANAEKAAWYLSTWQWHHSGKFPNDSLLAQMGYDIFGGTAVSIHGGMDPFALNYVNDLRDLAEYTGREQWAQRANGVWRHGQMCISDGDLVVDGKDPRPVGSQDEGLSYTIGRMRPYSPSQWLVAWPTAFRLEALRRILPEDGDRFGRVF